MQKKFEMRLVGELKYFLGFQVQQKGQRIFLSQTKYVNELLKKFRMKTTKYIGTLISTTPKLNKDEATSHLIRRSVEVGHVLFLYEVGYVLFLYLPSSGYDIMFNIYLYALFQVNQR